MARPAFKPLILDPPSQNAVDVLRDHRSRSPRALSRGKDIDRLPCSEVREAEVGDLALSTKRGDGLERLVERSGTIGLVQVEQIDRFDIEPAQRTFDTCPETGRGQRRVLTSVSMGHSGLRGQHYTVAILIDQRRDQTLGGRLRIAVGSVDPGDSGRNGRLEDLVRRGFGHRVAESHRSQHQPRQGDGDTVE